MTERTQSHDIPYRPGAGADLTMKAGAPDEQLRYWVEGESQPRVVIDVPKGLLLLGDGSSPPVSVSSAAVSRPDSQTVTAALGVPVNNVALQNVLGYDILVTIAWQGASLTGILAGVGPTAGASLSSVQVSGGYAGVTLILPAGHYFRYVRTGTVDALTVIACAV